MQDKNGEPSDWIEIYNPTNKDISLTGFSLSKNGGGDQPLGGYVIKAHDYIIVYCSSAGFENADFPHADFSIGKVSEAEIILKYDSFQCESIKMPKLNKGVSYSNENGCDSIISLGGGSSHDCAKAIALVASNGGNIRDYEGVDRSSNPLCPMIAVNTTAGTASEITRFCIITDTSRHVKMAIVDWRVTPQIAINDPNLMVGMPPALTAATGMDALTHAIEAYVSTNANPLTDAAALMSITMITQYLPKAVANGVYMKARDKMAYGQYLAGIAFNNASLGYVHAMAHQLGGMYNLPHGVCNAILLPHVEEFNLIGNANRFRDIAKAMGEITENLSTMDAARKAIAAIRQLSSQVGIPERLRDLGVKEEDFPVMAENAMKDVCSVTNPRKATKEQIIGIFKAAY